METAAVNISEIIADLRKEISERNYDPIPDFSDTLMTESEEDKSSEPFEMDFFLSETASANRTYYINPNVPVCGNFKLIKRVVRKFTYFIMQHLVNAQNEFNTHTIRCLNQIRNYVFSESEKLDLVKSIQETLDGDIAPQLNINARHMDKVREENFMLKNQVKEMENDIKGLNDENEKLLCRLEILEIKMKRLEELNK